MTTLGVLLIVGVWVALLLLAVALGRAARVGDDQMAATREYEAER